MLLGHGGGQGGRGGNTSTAINYIAQGGYGTAPYLVEINVVPNTTYTITIGQGGNGGAGIATAGYGGAGSNGGNTTFGSLYTFLGGQYSGSLGMMGVTPSSGLSWNGSTQTAIDSQGPYSYSQSVGVNSGNYLGGTQGGPGYFGSVGGSGGTGNNSGVGGNGGNATGFGAGGGGAGTGSTKGGDGGNGAPGQLWVIWVE